MNTLKLPDQLVGLLSQLDTQYNFPSGTMLALMKQESSGGEKYLKDPNAYHYEPDAKGIRRAPNGVVSTAFGPFGILESTAKDPGYGVAPLIDRTLEGQAKFAAAYLAGRSKAAGGLDKGLAGYGEGPAYAQAVAKKRDGGAPVAAPVMMAAATPSLPPSPEDAGPVMPAEAPVQVAQWTPTPAAQPAPVVPMGAAEAWDNFLAQANRKAAPVQQAAANQWDQGAIPEVKVYDFMAALKGLGSPQIRKAPRINPLSRA